MRCWGQARHERQLGSPRPAGDFDEATVDWISLIASSSDGPAERAERHEEIARSREALQTLKLAELRALTLLAEGYSYLQIGEITGFQPGRAIRYPYRFSDDDSRGVRFLFRAYVPQQGGWPYGPGSSLPLGVRGR